MWFGGGTGTGLPLLRPRDSLLVHHGKGTQIWTDRDHPPGQLRVARHGPRRIAVFGPCGATEEQLSRLASHPVPDDVAWRWPGSYTVVLLEPGRTTVWTDLGWAWPLYTTVRDDMTLWSSSALLLASLQGMRPNTEQMWDRLLGPHDSEADDTRSYFYGVRRVPPGHRITVHANGGVEEHPVWHPEPPDHELSRILRAELEGSVATRVATDAPMSADLSGGFDSTALALIAGRRLRDLGRDVLAVTTHPAGVETGGDLDFAREAGRAPGVHHVWLPMGPGDAPYQRMDSLPATDEPPPSAVSHAYLTGQLDRMRDMGRRLHITGDGGDGLLLTRPAHLLDLLRYGGLRRALPELALWAHVRRTSWWGVLQSARPTFKGTTPATRFPGLTRNQRETMDALLIAGRTARADCRLARVHGVDLHNPYFDSRLVHLMSSVPPDRLPGPARYKPLMAEAMADVFPPALAARTTKGDACPDHYGGLRRALTELERLLDGHLAGLGLLDPDRFRGTLHATAAGLRPGLYPVEAAVSLEAWLRALTRHRPVPWVREVERGRV
ncbi:albusnodin/ikarugamycin family macrolactam cyclase [Nocardiopsis protaetiae]|uniref:albusnodin/ikarugamycin family macrolactam cyclase n=1 Tax=Nocardiopsis protaetiae TaxID=3382270 RepID=UPI00387B95AF